MPTLDDDRFEAYLKKFRPIVPDALPVIANTQKSWRRLLLRSAVAAAAVILGVIGLHVADNRVTEKPSNSASPDVAVPKRPLTMQEANELLARAPSYKSAMDNLVLRSQGSVISNDKQSALAVLGKEKIKL